MSKHRMRHGHQSSNGERDNMYKTKRKKRILEQTLEHTDEDKVTVSTRKKRKIANKEKTIGCFANILNSKDICEKTERVQISRKERHTTPLLANSGETSTSYGVSNITELKHSVGGSFEHYQDEKDQRNKNEKINKIQRHVSEERNDKDFIATDNKKKEKKVKRKEGFENGILLKDVDGDAGEDQSPLHGERVLENKTKKKKNKERKEEAVEESQLLERERGSTIHEDVAESNGLANNDSHSKVTEKKLKKKKKVKKGEKSTFEGRVVDSCSQDHIAHVLSEPDDTEDQSYKDDVEEIWGVRFTPEEDDILRDAVWAYIKTKGWDKQIGLDKIFNNRKHRDARDCWAEIKMSLPHRPRQAVRFRARLVLEEGNHLGKWSKEEEDLLRQLQSKYGNKWREFSRILNRQRSCIKEKWRTLKRSETVKKKAIWSHGDLQELAEAVHESLRINRSQEKTKNIDHRILRDNIGWENIANTLGHHNHGSCCTRWYRFFESSLVTEGRWSIQDDFLLLKGLLESGASAEEEVEWDELLEHRSGQLCLTRWKQMIKHVGEKRVREFLDILDVLVHRYAPDLTEASLKENPLKTCPSET